MQITAGLKGAMAGSALLRSTPSAGLRATALAPSHAFRSRRLKHIALASIEPQTSSASSSAVAEPQAAKELEPLPEVELQYVEPSMAQKAMTNFKLAFALPWRRFKSGSVLVIKLSGDIPEQNQPRFGGSGTSMPALCQALQKAALDPRIKGVVIKVEPLAVGWAKLQELRRHIEFFRQSGKHTTAYIDRAGEKEYYLASACEELYAPPSAYLQLRGLSVSGTFLRGVLDKVGVEPQVKRIGKYKSAGDQLLRSDMSEPQREQLGALLGDIYQTFVADVARSRGKTTQEVEAMLDEGIFDMQKFKEGGWVTDLLYEDEVEELLKPRTGGKGKEVAKVGLSKYQKVSPSAFGLSGGKVIGVIRAAGAITGGGAGSGITSTAVIKELRRLKKNKKVAAVVLRVDSPGGDALASDLMWREIGLLAKEKPVIASMADVAASGGYYMSMAGTKVVAEALTITGSIGVVTGKFNLSELYQKAGYNKELISKGRYAELMADNRSFTPEEEALFDDSAQHAYESFRNKAAQSRGLSIEATQEVAQGRVWSGQAAQGIGLIDVQGGMNRAIQLAKQAAGIPLKDAVTLLEVSRAKRSPLQLLSAGGASTGLRWAATLGMLLQNVLQGGGLGTSAGSAAATAVGAPLLMELAAAVAVTGSSGNSSVETATQLASSLAAGQVLALMPSVTVEGAGSQAMAGVRTSSSTEGGLFEDC